MTKTHGSSTDCRFEDAVGDENAPGQHAVDERVGVLAVVQNELPPLAEELAALFELVILLFVQRPLARGGRVSG